MQEDERPGLPSPSFSRTQFFTKTENMSGFPKKKRMDKKKKERTPVVKSGPQVLAEQRRFLEMQKRQKNAETMRIIKRWVDLKKILQKPPEKKLEEIREAEKRLAEDRLDMQRQERWREWMQKERELWKAEQRRKEQELNSSKKKLEGLQETKTPHTQVVKSLTIMEELKMMDELLEETADIKVPSMSPIHQPASPTPTRLPLGKDGVFLGLTTTKPLEAQARHPHRVKDPTSTPLPKDTPIYTHPLANQEEGLESELARMQVLEASVEEGSSSDILKIENEIKAEKGKAAKKEREFLEKQKKAEKLAQEKMEKKQRKQLEQAEKRNMEIQRKLENERCKMKDLERKEMQRLAEEQRKDIEKTEKEEKKAEKEKLEMRSLPKCGFFEKIKRAFHFH
ncbi:intersectin-2-like isoform X2 [Hypomesus transpacificus]|uniref:intersectin-2-like isoform X2 n=1 Tax=Hypomesus transpacificus TaxID=137520 RepID=UPI001F0765C5|nr:intersectin-2-like isoform X2 [Hypomesus transpacificus]